MLLHALCVNNSCHGLLQDDEDDVDDMDNEPERRQPPPRQTGPPLDLEAPLLDLPGKACLKLLQLQAVILLLPFVAHNGQDASSR